MAVNATTIGNLIPNAIAETLKHQLQKNTRIDKNDVLSNIVSKIKIDQLVESFYKKLNPTFEISEFTWLDDIGKAERLRFSCRLWSDHKIRGLEKPSPLLTRSDISQEQNDDMIKLKKIFIDQMTGILHGELELLNYSIDKLKLTYEQEAVTFHAYYQFDYKVNCILSWQGKSDPMDVISVGQFNKWYRISTVPLRLLRCWMNNKSHDPSENVDKPSAVNNIYVYYGSERYSIWLCELFRSYRNRALKVFFDAGFVNKLVYDIISEGIPNSPDTPNGSKPTDAIVIELKKQEEDPEVRRLEQLAEISLEDQKRLRIIHNAADSHAERPWAKILGYEGTGGSGPFIKRMNVAGLVSKEVVPGKGFRLRLTNRALGILYAPTQPYDGVL